MNRVIATPICDFVRDYAASGKSRFHMPGHKGRFPGPAAGIAGADSLYASDITEIAGADSLYEANGIIRESEQNAALLFGSAATFYSTEGSSQCIRAMLAMVSGFGFPKAYNNACRNSSARPLILAARNVHRSFLTACALLDLDVEWLFSESAPSSFCTCPISAEQVRTVLRKMPVKPAAIYLTSPDYLGNLQDISGIAAAAHEYHVPLLADNAHGAYLHFLNPPVHPLDLGADLCCDSAHKTLPSLTGCAYLHINAASEYCGEFISSAKMALSLFGSTSPSYLLLQSLDALNPLLGSTFPGQLQECTEKLRALRAALQEDGWTLMGSEPLKITIHASDRGISGTALGSMLRERDIECEFSDPDDLVLMISPSSKEQDYERLRTALHEIADLCPEKKSLRNPRNQGESSSSFLPVLPAPNRILSIRQALSAASELIPAEQSEGRICTDSAVACPPAIPVIVCGERIPKEAIAVFRYYGILQIRVLKQ